MSGPKQADVDALRDLLDLMENFSDNDQRARYLLTCNWFRDRDAALVAAFKAEAVAAIEAEAYSWQSAAHIARNLNTT